MKELFTCSGFQRSTLVPFGCLVFFFFFFNVGVTHLEKVQVVVPFDAGDLQVSHHHLAVLVELVQRVVVLVQI